DCYVAVCSMHLLFDLHFSIGVSIGMCIFPNQSRVGIFKNFMSLSQVRCLKSLGKHWLTVAINNQFTANIAGFGGIDANEPARSSTLVPITPTCDVNSSPVQNRRGDDVIAITLRADVPLRCFIIDVELPNDLARSGVE